ncbi:excinuclease ABC subunit UvrA [Paracidovorax citrulli]|uniref:UvrABC system protein A n=2 Tax=Paracidovorax citrulli TaxID=80869 RepID=A1TP16_PARC0|nr:excinuclease ABC subunit UvrA [Paracidovorax citrulli]ABM32704.1 excinuclease ABC, A subunit [Paracidovorax citrulli AAC00-1]ATG93299.1 excinuclease ABC subunit UvrA [Paracidovorax citrulli]PVY66921.1 excinuclease ABC subunit A [Paracidovorax citrulli]REG68916.1 excinuclease ABC subunit A [Paracidovorax citrulli]RLJ93471.1 excinuclease ABC subunit A [Paracidovorax citrulli]
MPSQSKPPSQPKTRRTARSASRPAAEPSASLQPAPPAAAPAAPSIDGFVRVRGAREHNLRNVDVDIPRDALVVFTGVSGSGKSSLAFGTLYAEAQRRYLESVAPYARRLIDQAGTPEVDAIDGLPPAVALQQQRGTPTARSSVGSATTISSLLRLLYSRAGQYPARQPMLYAEDFSPNTPEGACPHCHGMGRVYEVTERSLVPDDRLTIRERAVAAWPTAWGGQNLRDILVMLGHDVDVPWRDLPRKTRDWILFTDEQPVVPVYAGLDRKAAQAARKAGTPPSYMGTFSSARRHVLHSFAHSQSARMRERAAAFLVGSPCPACGGKRLKPEALSVTFAGHDIAELGRLPLGELARLLQPVAEGRLGDSLRPSGGPRAPVARPGADSHRAHIARRVAAGGSAHAAAPDVRRTPDLSEEKVLAAQRLAQEIGARIAALSQLGLHYLTLDRSTPSLSSGELQRLRLATQLGSQLFGVVYVLDEPSAGLHPADGEALRAALHRLKRAGNSLFVVEHDLATMRAADWLVDVGPGAGMHGGEVLYSGPPDGLAAVQPSRTRRYLFPGRDGPAPVQRTPREAAGWLRLEGIGRHNLKGVDAAFPVGCLTAVTGVSGSGKSSLVSRALVELVAQALGSPLADAREDEESVPDGSPGGPPHAAPQDDDPGAADDPGGATSGRIAELAGIRRLVRVDQKPIGRTPRSNLATYTGLFDGVRKLFAATPAARRRRYGPGRFSFNVAAGRCPTCEGEGSVSVELLFLPSVYAPCPDCHGARYNPATLEVRWNGLDIADVLRLTVDAACEAFAREAAVLRPLALLREIGLGYLRLGQPATELSGGEAQRIKLATELQRPQRGDTLYVLDEPTTGLHPADVDRLLVQLDGLAAAGNTVVVVEHDMRVVAACDWVIDMGPGAGGDGGRIVAAGTPSEVARQAGSRTAPYLARALAGEPGA